MTMIWPPKADPKLDLVLDRIIDVPRDLVWEALTKPDHVMKWFSPRPWTTTECEIDLRPGGVFRTVFRSPEGELTPNLGCFLEVVPQQRIVWTDALLPGFRPAPAPFMTAFIVLACEGTGTRYPATVVHGDEAVRKRHEEMGFHGGWGTALDQMVEVVKGMRR